jgi:hypothetical protein
MGNNDIIFTSNSILICDLTTPSNFAFVTHSFRHLNSILYLVHLSLKVIFLLFMEWDMLIIIIHYDKTMMMMSPVLCLPSLHHSSYPSFVSFFSNGIFAFRDDVEQLYPTKSYVYVYWKVSFKYH